MYPSSYLQLEAVNFQQIIRKATLVEIYISIKIYTQSRNISMILSHNSYKSNFFQIDFRYYLEIIANQRRQKKRKEKQT